MLRTRKRVGGAPADKVRPRDRNRQLYDDQEREDQVLVVVPAPRVELDASVLAAQRRRNGL